ncbi:MAG: p-cumate dioxygenase [Betaproteobacteria bacterium]|nr:p-cumate dioxygenase [Betaproteobacteria bacterium]
MLNLDNIHRSDVEDFLFQEAALLDAWQLDDWLELLTENAQYMVPSNDEPNGKSGETLFMISDNIQRIRERVVRLKDPQAHAEFPRSRTRRVISNVRITDWVYGDQPAVGAQANFVIYRHRRDQDIRTYVGSYQYILEIRPEGLRIASRTVVLDAFELGQMGLLSFII